MVVMVGWLVGWWLVSVDGVKLAPPLRKCNKKKPARKNKFTGASQGEQGAGGQHQEHLS
jgi:hypothetical protein